MRLRPLSIDNRHFTGGASQRFLVIQWKRSRSGPIVMRPGAGDRCDVVFAVGLRKQARGFPWKRHASCRARSNRRAGRHCCAPAGCPARAHPACPEPGRRPGPRTRRRGHRAPRAAAARRRTGGRADRVHRRRRRRPESASSGDRRGASTVEVGARLQASYGGYAVARVMSWDSRAAVSSRRSGISETYPELVDIVSVHGQDFALTGFDGRRHTPGYGRDVVAHPDLPPLSDPAITSP